MTYPQENMQRRILFVQPNLSQGGNPALPPSSYNRKPFFWNVHQDDGSGAILANLLHHRRSYTGSMTLIEPFEEFRVTKIRHERTWQLQSSSPEEEPLHVTANHPKWWRRMIEFEMHGQRFVLSSKRRMHFEFVVHRATPNLNAPGKRREREKEGELVGEIWAPSMSRLKLMVSFNEDIGLKFQLFCTWLLLLGGVHQNIKPRYGGSSGMNGNHHDSLHGNSDDGCFDDHGFDGDCGGDSSCEMDGGGDSGCD